jgi:hypothetical protein
MLLVLPALTCVPLGYARTYFRPAHLISRPLVSFLTLPEMTVLLLSDLFG